MKEHIIYALFNPLKTKVYVGETSNLKERKRHHIYYGNRGYEKEQGINEPDKDRNGLYKDMKEQGSENFIFIILENCHQEERLEREKFWINLLQKKYKLYNVAAFGGACYGEQNGNYGLEFSKERRERIAIKAKERLSTPGNNPKARKVVAIKDGVVIKRFNTVIETYGWNGFSKRKTYASLQKGREYDGIKIEYEE